VSSKNSFGRNAAFVGSDCRACGNPGALVLRPSRKSVNRTSVGVNRFYREPRHRIRRPALRQKRLAKFPFGEAAIFAAIRFAVRQFF